MPTCNMRVNLFLECREKITAAEIEKYKSPAGGIFSRRESQNAVLGIHLIISIVAH